MEVYGEQSWQEVYRFQKAAISLKPLCKNKGEEIVVDIDSNCLMACNLTNHNQRNLKLHLDGYGENRGALRRAPLTSRTQFVIGLWEFMSPTQAGTCPNLMIIDLTHGPFHQHIKNRKPNVPMTNETCLCGPDSSVSHLGLNEAPISYSHVLLMPYFSGFWVIKDPAFARSKPLVLLFFAGVMATLLHSDSRRLYSWWWDSHISPKNSKWLQENLTDMDAKVKAMIKLIEEDADSFARRAEMYYKKRPELMKLVEEFYRAYRALAERYDHATGELRQAHRTMAEAFPNQVPYALADDSPSSSSAPEAEPHTPEMPHPIRALLDPDDLQKDALGLSSSNLHAVKRNGAYSEESESGIRKRGLKQLNEMFRPGEVPPQTSKLAEGKTRRGMSVHEVEEKDQSLYGFSQLSNENQRLEAERAGRAESELRTLKKTLAELQSEKEAVLLRYQQSLENLSYMERELNRAQRDAGGLDERASKAETEIKKLKEALVKLEAERDAGLLQYKQCLERISNLETMNSLGREDAKGLNERAIKAEIEAQYLKQELSRLKAEKEAGLLLYKQCLEKIAAIENKISIVEEDSRMLNERTDRAETEVKNLKEALAKLNEEKEAAALQYQRCLETIAKLESEISQGQEDAKRLNSEILMGAAKLRGAEEQCVLLDRSNQFLQLEMDNLAQKMARKDQELSEKQMEVEKLQICVQDEHSQFLHVETTLETLQKLHSQSQEEQKVLAMELKNGLQMLKDLEICNHGLEKEIHQFKEENNSLNELNLASTISIKNLGNEISSLREMKEKLEEEVALQVDQSNALQQELYRLKEEIKELKWRYQSLMNQIELVGLSPECLGSSVKELQDENSKLKEICKKGQDENKSLLKKLEDMEKVLEKNAFLETSLLDVSKILEGSKAKVKALEESCWFLQGEKSTLVAEKATLFSQLQTVTENMQKLLEKNSLLENSLAGANIELEGLRAKSKSLEEICQLLKNEKSNLLTERGTLGSQLENVERRLENLENRSTELEKRYAGLEKEKESTLCQVKELRDSLDVEQQERARFMLSSEARLTGLENHIYLLQEESRLRKKEFEGELDKAVNAQLEIFILQKFIQDLEEKNFSLLIECQKHVEASKLSDKLISELESENLEQRVEAEFLLDEVEKLRMGIAQVFKAFQIDPDNGCEDKIEQEQTLLPSILGKIKEMETSVSKNKDEKQQLVLENLVLLTFLWQLKLEGTELESEKKTLDQKFKTMKEQLALLQNEKHELLEMNKQLRLLVSNGDQQEEVLKAEMENLCMKLVDLEGAYLVLQEENLKALEQNRFLLNEFSDLKEEKCMLEDENSVILHEAEALSNLSLIFKCFGTEKALELKALAGDLGSLRGVNSDLKKEVGLLGEKLETKETENLHLKESLEKLDKELLQVRDLNDQLKYQITIEKDSLIQKEMELSEVEQKLKATENLNTEVCTTVKALKRDCEESKLMSTNLERRILELSEDKNKSNKKIEYLCDVNGKLESELLELHEEIEERRIREENLCSELQDRSNEFELWEAEAATFYFDLQISTVREVLVENKVHELTGVCESLEEESASKSLEIEHMKERVSFFESEIKGLKAQLSAYVPVIVSLRDDIASLEQNALFRTKLPTTDYQESKDVEVVTDLHGKSCQEPEENQSIAVPDGISDLQKMQRRIKEVEKAMVEEVERLAMQETLNIKIKLEAAMKEIEELKSKSTLHQERGIQEEENGTADELSDYLMLQKAEPEISEAKNVILMKDIPLDEVSDSSFSGKSRRGNGGADDQMLQLWEAAEQNCTHDPRVSETQTQASALMEDDIVCHQFEDIEPNSKDPSSDLQVEKELSVDKLELSMSVREPNQEGNKRKILERLASDAQKLMSIQVMVQDLRRKMETNKKGKKAKDDEFETLKEQLQEVEEAVVQQMDFNGQLTNNTEESPLSSDGTPSADLEEARNIQRKRVLEQARRGSEKIGRLMLEVQKIQYVWLKLEDEKKSKGKNRSSKSRTSILLRDFIYSVGKGSERRKKASLCGCLRPSSMETEIQIFIP
ncbi:hypothetical protein L1049_017061 [Liquidambar formosana]|uniref:NAB domain-containing protein n=1 Tax=Liquidambar formosana TaxID=63359 RepID=A0AAP0S6Z5_LIQFO